MLSWRYSLKWIVIKSDPSFFIVSRITQNHQISGTFINGPLYTHIVIRKFG